MIFKNITLIDENFDVQKGMNVVVKNGKIVRVCRELPQDVGNSDEIYDGHNKLLMPGFVNAHAHTPMTLLRGYSENKTLQDWLFKDIFPFEDKMTPHDVYNGMMLGIAEMLRFGVVSTSDMYFSCDKMCEAAIETGTKFNISNGMTCFDDGDFKDNNAFKETQIMLRDYHGANGGAVLADASVHAEYTSNPRIVGQVLEYAKENELNMHLHLSETKTEHEECVKRHGKTPAKYFSDIGIFELSTTAAHCVWVTAKDIDILKRAGVTVASNPISNLKLASGVCPAGALLRTGVNVAIGTDGMASNNNINILEDVKMFSLIHKGVNYDPLLITPKEAFRAATVNGFRAQGRGDCGLIKEGYKADLIVVDLDKPYYYPSHNILNDLLYSGVGTDVCLTMVDGKVLYRDEKYTTLDIEKVVYNASNSVKQILARL